MEEIIKDITRLMIQGTLPKEEGDKVILALIEKQKTSWLSEKAEEKLEFILGRSVTRNFPNTDPDLEWAGAVLDLLEEIGLYKED